MRGVLSSGPQGHLLSGCWPHQFLRPQPVFVFHERMLGISLSCWACLWLSHARSIAKKCPENCTFCSSIHYSWCQNMVAMFRYSDVQMRDYADNDNTSQLECWSWNDNCLGLVLSVRQKPKIIGTASCVGLSFQLFIFD